MIMLLEQDQMVQCYRWHLTFAFGLLEPLLHQSILFLAHHKQRTLHAFSVINPISHFLEPASCSSVYGGPAGYRPRVLNVYAVPLNDLSKYIYSTFIYLCQPVLQILRSKGEGVL